MLYEVITTQREQKILVTPSSGLTEDEISSIIDDAIRERRPLSVGLIANAAEVLRELVTRGVTPDIVTALCRWFLRLADERVARDLVRTAEASGERERDVV